MGVYDNVMFYGVKYTFKEVESELSKRKTSKYKKFSFIWQEINEFCEYLEKYRGCLDDEGTYIICTVIDKNTTMENLYKKSKLLENAIKNVSIQLNIECRKPHFFTESIIY